MAREMMRFTMANVLQQAATAMLAQAKQMPNNLFANTNNTITQKQKTTSGTFSEVDFLTQLKIFDENSKFG